MKKHLQKLLVIFLLLIIGKPLSAQDQLVDYTYLGTKTKIELFFLFGEAVDYDVSLYKIRYKTLDVHGVPDTASGLLVLPLVAAGTLLPIVVYEHGTTEGPMDVPSQQRGGYQVAMAYAAFGFATIAPDFLGLGDARGFHPYVHAASESSASLDMLIAGYEYMEANDPQPDPQFLFLAGYSQGGHASMALHKEIDEIWSFVFPVTAATHMSGPYSISGVMRDKILSDESYGFPAYIAYVMLGYNEAYGDLYTNLNEIFKEPYASSIDQFYQGIINLDTLNNHLISSLAAGGDTINKRMFHDSVITAIINQPDHPINVAMAANDTYNWAPSSPTRLYYCGADEQVPFENSLVAESTMQALGAPDVLALNLNPSGDHGDCVLPAISESIAFFQSFLNSSDISDLDKHADELTAYPNPAFDEVVIDWEAAREGMDYQLINSNGQQVTQGYSADNRISIEHLPGGLYVIVCTAGGETRLTRFVHP